MFLGGHSGNRGTEKILPSVLLISMPCEIGGSAWECSGLVLDGFMELRFPDIVFSLR